jgi:hypothetical protein
LRTLYSVPVLSSPGSVHSVQSPLPIPICHYPVVIRKSSDVFGDEISVSRCPKHLAYADDIAQCPKHLAYADDIFIHHAREKRLRACAKREADRSASEASCCLSLFCCERMRAVGFATLLIVLRTMSKVLRTRPQGAEHLAHWATELLVLGTEPSAQWGKAPWHLVATAGT